MGNGLSRFFCVGFRIFLMLVALFSLWQDRSMAQTKTVKIGALLTLTGPLAQPGQEVKWGIELAKDDINKAGGIKTLGGTKIEIAYADSQARPDIGTSETERLVEREKVVAIVDMYPSVVTMAASARAERLKTPFLAGISYSDNLTDRGFKYYFQLLTKIETPNRGGAWVVVDYMEYLAKLAGRKIERPAVIFEDTDLGQSGSRGVKKFLGEKGYKPVDFIGYPSRAPDLTPVVSKLKAAKADVVLIGGGYLGDEILLVKTADRLGFNVPIIDTGGMDNYSFIKALQDLAEYQQGFAPCGNDIGPKYRDLNDRYQAKSGEKMSNPAYFLYQAVWVVKEALELAKDTDRESLRAALSKVRINPGPTMFVPWEFIRFGQYGMNTGMTPLVRQIQGGNFVTVFPEKLSAGKAKINPKWWK